MHDVKSMSKVLRHTLGDRLVSTAIDALDNLSEGYLSKDVPTARLEALRMMKVNISRHNAASRELQDTTTAYSVDR